MRIILAGSILLLLHGAVTAQARPCPDRAERPCGEHTWIELTSGEWLKGDITAIYDSVLYFDSDHFGNLQTNIDAESLNSLCGHDKSRTWITVKGKSIIGIQDTYADKDPGDLLALLGSRGFLEIAEREGNAAAYLDARTGDTVKVEMLKVEECVGREGKKTNRT